MLLHHKLALLKIQIHSLAAAAEFFPMSGNNLEDHNSSSLSELTPPVTGLLGGTAGSAATQR